MIFPITINNCIADILRFWFQHSNHYHPIHTFKRTAMSASAAPGGYSNPARLNVATATAGAEGGAGPSNLGERERLLRAKKRNDEIRRKGEKWADKLMEETVDREVFKRAVSLLHVSLFFGHSLCALPCPALRSVNK